jgi:hypothetical protein
VFLTIVHDVIFRAPKLMTPPASTEEFSETVQFFIVSVAPFRTAPP